MDRASPSHEDFADFYDLTYGSVVGQVYALVGDLGEAQDITQEAFLRLWQRWERVSAYDDPTSWVRRVAHHLAISRWRRARAAVVAMLRYRPPTITGEPTIDSIALVSALRQIPPPQRRALVLHHMAGFSVAEIAGMDGASPAAIKMRLFHGRAALAAVLAEPADEKDPKVRHG